MEAVPVMLTPAQVAERLEVSGAALRRMAGTYEKHFGPLPRPSGSPSRLWPSEAVEKLEEARGMVAQGRATDLEAALAALASGSPVPTLPAPALPLEGDGLAAVLGQLQALARLPEEVRALRGENSALREEVAALRGLIEQQDEARARELSETRALIEQEGRLIRAAGAATGERAPQLAPRGLLAQLLAYLRR